MLLLPSLYYLKCKFPTSGTNKGLSYLFSFILNNRQVVIMVGYGADGIYVLFLSCFIHQVHGTSCYRVPGWHPAFWFDIHWDVRLLFVLFVFCVFETPRTTSEPDFLVLLRYFIFTSFWAYKIYYVYGFMMLVLVILCIVTVCVTIVCTYFLLNAEDYRWWVSQSISLFFCCGLNVMSQKGLVPYISLCI